MIAKTLRLPSHTFFDILRLGEISWPPSLLNEFPQEKFTWI
jgi:hypothetical protein